MGLESVRLGGERGCDHGDRGCEVTGLERVSLEGERV